MRFLDHNPPHFHARYQNYKVLVEIENGTIRGEMSERALRLILEWEDGRIDIAPEFLYDKSA